MSDDAGDEDELLPAYRGEEHVQVIGGSPHYVGFLAAAHADHGAPDRPVLQVSADERRAFRSRSERRVGARRP